MLNTLIITCFISITAVSGLFFSSGGCGCQPSCCAPPPPCSCPAAQPCGGGYSQYQPAYSQSGYAQPPQFPQQPFYPQPLQQPVSYSQSYPQSYPQSFPQSFPQPIQQDGCQPKYIIVRPAEQLSPVLQPAQQYNVVPEATPQSATQPIPSPPSTAGSYKTDGNSYKARASKTILVDARCNSSELRQLLEENIVTDDANESKRRIHKAANEQFTTQNDNTSNSIDVICAPGAFSYRIATEFFCEHAKGNITCFAYLQHSA